MLLLCALTIIYHSSSVLAVSGIQITIAVMGRFTEDRLSEYVLCLEESLRTSPNIPQNFSISDNSTFPVSPIDSQVQCHVLVLFYSVLERIKLSMSTFLLLLCSTIFSSVYMQ